MNADERLENLSVKKTAVIMALLNSETIESAARKAKTSKVTVYKYLRDPEFAALLAAGREEIFNDAIGQLKTSARLAVRKLTLLIVSDNENQARLASATVLNFALKGSEYRDLESRIEAIEKILEERKSYVS